MKRIIFRTLLICLICISIPLPTKAYDFKSSGLCYNILSSSTVELTYYSTSFGSNKNYVSGSLSIPETVTYNGTEYSVTSIGYWAFSGCSGLTSVTIPNSVKSIGQYAFLGCSGLTSVTIPNSVKSIGQSAFSGCTGLTSVTIPNSVTSIGVSAFNGCTGLTSVTIPNSVISIGDRAFSRCTGLTSVTIPNSVTDININPFYGCQNLETIKVESGNTHYDSRGDCNAIINTRENVLISGCNYTEIPNSVTSIGDWAFYGCSGLKSVTIPNSVTSIGDWAFSRCTGLTSVTIPNSVTSIDAHAFYGCSGLTSVTIPNSVTSIGDYAFSGCTGLTSINYNAVNIPSPSSLDYALFNDCRNITKFTIGESVKSIPNYLCYGMSGIRSITIPDSVTSIGTGAFSGCTGLTSVTYNAVSVPSPSSLENAFFKDCTHITTFKIGKSVKTIPSYLCYGLSNIQSISIPDSVSSIGSEAFAFCYGLPSINIPSTVTSIAREAFYSCTGLTSVKIPNSVSSIDGSAFSGCANATIRAFPIPYLLLRKTEIQEWDSLCLVGAPYFTVNDYSVHQESVEFSGEYNNYESAPEGYENLELIESGIKFNDVFYPINSENKVTIKNLCAHNDYDFVSYTKYNDGAIYLSDTIFITTDSLYLTQTITEEKATSIFAQFGYKKDDMELQSEYITYNGQTIPGGQLKLTALKPNTTYDASYTVTTKCGSSETLNCSFTTSDLQLVMRNTNAVTNSSAIVSAATTMSDIETSAGFQWKEYDAPDSVEPSEGFFAIYNGRLEGYIKNLQSTALYKVRAFYKDAEGTYYYTDWVMFDPSNFSYCDPTVHTYPTNEVTTCSATVKGYVLQGSDEILSQGIEYWCAGTSDSLINVMSTTATNDKDTVFSTGQVMNVTLNNLISSTSYCYRAFVTTQSGTYNGEEQTFTTKFDPDNVNPVTEITLSNTSLILPVSHERQLSATVLPTTATIKKLRWASSDDQVATVSSEGLVTAVAVGNATITATATDGSEVSASCSVEVVANQDEAIAALNQLVESAEQLYHNSTEGNDLGQYEFGARAELLDAIVNVKARISSTMTAEEITECTNAINAAIELFESKKVTITEDTDISSYENIIYVEPTEAYVGTTIDLSLKMNNTIEIVGFQCDFYPPEGTEIAVDADGFEEINLSNERTTSKRTDFFGTGAQPDGSMRILASSTSLLPFTGNEGEIATIKLNIGSDMEDGDYPLIIRNTVFSDADGNAYKVNYVKTSIKIRSYILGDSNGDGEINIADFSAIANYILGHPKDSFVLEAADTNQDGEISVADLSKLIKLILSSGTSSSPAQSAPKATKVVLCDTVIY